MAEVTLKGVHKAFGDNAIVRGVDLEIASGELMVLVGPSGCGKTTLLRLIAGLEQADAGDISIAGVRVNEVSPRDRDVGMVFQSYALYPHMTVRENLAFGLVLRKTPRAELDARVAEAAALLELSPLLERKPKELSGGQRQRVAMGRAIVRRPRVFLFDEPLSNLDAALRVQMRGELQRLHQRLRSTMIYVTHDQVEAMTLATRLAVFNQGILQQVGAPLHLYENPANRFVAGFLGSPAMSFLPGRVQGQVVAGKGFSFALPAGAQVAAQDVLVGLRPQALRIAAEGALRGEVEAIERLGSEGYVYVRTEAGPVTARFEGAADLHVGALVAIAADAASLQLFAAADGTAIALRPPPAVRAAG